jgi:hypothetical protein
MIVLLSLVVSGIPSKNPGKYFTCGFLDPVENPGKFFTGDVAAVVSSGLDSVRMSGKSRSRNGEKNYEIGMGVLRTFLRPSLLVSKAASFVWQSDTQTVSQSVGPVGSRSCSRSVRSLG